MIIDVHAHTYPARIVKKVVQRMEMVSGKPIHVDGTPRGLVTSMAESGVDYSIFLPVATAASQVPKLNEQAAEVMETYGADGLLAFGAIHPDTPDLAQTMREIRAAGLLGVKIHPDYQGTYFDDIRYLRILDAAASEGLLVLAHAGMDEVYPEEVHCDVPRILRVIEKVGGGRLILAHMGGWQMWDQVKKYLCGAPVYFDTAFSLTGTVNVENTGNFGSMLDDERFVELVRSHGVEKILFGSDTPWSTQQENVDWICGCSLEEEEKQMILGENAEKLLFFS